MTVSPAAAATPSRLRTGARSGSAQDPRPPPPPRTRRRRRPSPGPAGWRRWRRRCRPLRTLVNGPISKLYPAPLQKFQNINRERSPPRSNFPASPPGPAGCPSHPRCRPPLLGSPCVPPGWAPQMPAAAATGTSACTCCRAQVLLNSYPRKPELYPYAHACMALPGIYFRIFKRFLLHGRILRGFQNGNGFVAKRARNARPL